MLGVDIMRFLVPPKLDRLGPVNHDGYIREGGKKGKKRQDFSYWCRRSSALSFTCSVEIRLLFNFSY